MKKTLVILAAGIGSRFGGGIKQLSPVDDKGHIIIDYSIHDAIQAGFNKIVFIIRHDIEKDFKDAIGNRIEEVCGAKGVEVCYAFQELANIPIALPEGRTKPWGTGHAVLACDGILEEPFAVINADDYYGKEGFQKAAAFLEENVYGMVGYVLRNTLSDNGGVIRGICTVKDDALVGIDETKEIVKDGTDARSGDIALSGDALVSMNFWCFPSDFIDVLKKGFPEFLSGMNNPLKDEYLLPIIVDGMLKEGGKVTVLPSQDKWFGVTYQEDKPAVIESFKKLREEGVYQADLYADM